MAKCFDVVGYVEPCNAVRQKYTGRALLMTGVGTKGTIQGTSELSDNGLKITGIYELKDYSSIVQTFVDEGGKAFLVSIDAENPFGVTVQGNTDSGRVMYTKTVPVSIPATRDGKAEEFIMGLQKGMFVLLLLCWRLWDIPTKMTFSVRTHLFILTLQA